MVPIIKGKLNTDELNKTLRSLQEKTSELKSTFADQQQLFMSNLNTINSWMGICNNYWLQLRQYEAYISSLEGQGVIVPKDPIYCYAIVAPGSTSSRRLGYRMGYTKTKDFTSNLGSRHQAKVTFTDSITLGEAEGYVAGGSKVQFIAAVVTYSESIPTDYTVEIKDLGDPVEDLQTYPSTNLPHTFTWSDGAYDDGTFRNYPVYPLESIRTTPSGEW